MNTQPQDSVTIRDSKTGQIITTVQLGSRAVMYRDTRGVRATMGGLHEAGVTISEAVLAKIAAAGAETVDIADEYVY